MKRFSEHIKNGLYILIIGLLFIPIVQKKFKFITVEPLNGAFETVEDPFITKSAWLEGDFQIAQEDYAKNNFGFRETLVRIYNQWNFSLYSKTNSEGVVIGKEGYLYEGNYIRAQLGIDYLGKDSIRKQVNKLKIISDSLKKHNVDLVILLAPGKGSFYPEYFPDRYYDKRDRYYEERKGKTNHDEYVKQLKKSNINLLDAHSWFREMKVTDKEHTLFSKAGIHWSKYGEYLMADSLVNYLSKVTGKPFPHMQLDSVERSKRLRNTDNDAWESLNIFTDIPDFEMTYPFFHVENIELNKTKVLTISDSYYWGLFNSGLSRDYFAGGEFWYYYRERYPLHYDSPSLVSEANIKKEVLKHDVVLIICTDANLSRLGFGFIENFK